IVITGVNEFSPRASPSFTFHRKLKPGFCMLSREIFGSERTQPERCASLPAVIQSPPPPRCAHATPMDRAHAPERITAPASLRIWKLLFILLFGQSLSDGVLGQRSHDLVPRVVRQEAVAGQFLLEIASVHQRPVVIQINRSTLGGLILQPPVQPDNLARRPARGPV